MAARCPFFCPPQLEFRLNNQWFSKIAVWLVIALVLFTVFKQFDARGAAGAGAIGDSEFLEEVRNDRIRSATTTDGSKIHTNASVLDRGLVGDLLNHNVKFDVKPREEGSLLLTLLINW